MTLRKKEEGVFRKVLYVIFVSNTWQPLPHKARVGRGRQLQNSPTSPHPPYRVHMFLTLYMSQLLGYLVTQPVEEKALLLLDPKFACIESSSPTWLPCLLMENLKPLYLPKRTAGHPARWEARKLPLQAFPHHPH